MFRVGQHADSPYVRDVFRWRVNLSAEFRYASRAGIDIFYGDRSKPNTNGAMLFINLLFSYQSYVSDRVSGHWFRSNWTVACDNPNNRSSARWMATRASS